jgi:voltage-gated potassium channel
MSIKNIVEDNSCPKGRIFDLFIQTLIVLSLITFSVETMPNISDETRALLRAIEVITVSIFTTEYLLRILVSDRKLSFLFSFYGLVDLAAILPFYLATGLDMRSLRAFRLLRLFRAFKLLRYSKAMSRFHRAFLIAKEELVLFTVVTAMLLYFSASGIYFFENDAQPEVFTSIFSSLWWAVATLTTVGYGDIYPITTGGKLFTFFMLMIGLGVIAVPTGLVASALSKAREEE